MKILKNAGKSTLIATWPSPETNANAQMVMEKAGRTCYQSEKHPITPESAQKFVGNVHNRTHYSVLEHGWRGYIIKDQDGSLLDLYRMWYPVSKYMYFSERCPEMTLLISANLETWRKAWKRRMLTDKAFDGIRYDLSNFCPAIFPKVTFEKSDDYYFSASPIDDTTLLKTSEERLNHIAHTVVYDNCCRGFTHEEVRHRPPVFSQESTRYVDESDFTVVVPPHRDEHQPIYHAPATEHNDEYRYGPSFVTMMYEAEKNYQALRRAGWKAEDARQVLPTAIKAQIAMSCNLLERRYIYFRRTSEFAHWEIRKVMFDELRKFQVLYPIDLCMFEFTNEPAKDGIPGYCKLKQEYDASFFCD